MKSPDRYGLPMCWFPDGDNCHGQIEAIGSKNELVWFEERGIFALDMCDALWSVKDSFDKMVRVFWEEKED